MPQTYQKNLQNVIFGRYLWGDPLGILKLPMKGSPTCKMNNIGYERSGIWSRN